METEIAQLDWSWIGVPPAAWALVMARAVGVCMTAPAIVVPGLEWRFRLVLALLLGALIVPMVEPSLVSIPVGSGIAWAGTIEVLVGGLLGWSAALIVAGARQAGDLVAAQAGLVAAALFDPETGDELTALGHLYGLIALAVFLALDGPLVLVGALVESYRAVPAGGLAPNGASLAQAFAQVGHALELSLRAAAPPAVALALAGIVLGWIGRLAPALPVLALSLPVRSILGIVLVLLSLSTLVATLAQAWMSWSIAPWGHP
jgi:flagellar biosynthesis protein FliR